MSNIIVSFHGKTYVLPTTGISDVADYDKLWQIVLQNPSSQFEFNQALLWSQYWYNVKYLGMTYHPKIMNVLRRFSKK